MIRAVWSIARIAAVVAVAALSGCLSAPVREAPSADVVAARQRERSEWLSLYATWSFSGRAAIGVGDRGGSGRIEWEQHDRDRYSVSLSAPVTRQSWRLSGDLRSGSGRIEGLEGGPRDGDSAEALLLQTTGWRVPVRELSQWVRGAPAEGIAVEAAEYDAEGRPALLRQSGWTVRYTEWRPGPVGQPDLPARIEAESGNARIRLAIEDWTFATL
jgi:outer membrane lipoprotein LolB